MERERVAGRDTIRLDGNGVPWVVCTKPRACVHHRVCGVARRYGHRRSALPAGASKPHRWRLVNDVSRERHLRWVKVLDPGGPGWGGSQVHLGGTGFRLRSERQDQARRVRRPQPDCASAQAGCGPDVQQVGRRDVRADSVAIPEVVGAGEELHVKLVDSARLNG